MAYFIQQDRDNIVVSKEIVTLFQVTTFKILNLNNDDITSYTFSDTGEDFYVQDKLKESGVYELLIPLFNQDIPIERLYYDVENLTKTRIMVPKLGKRIVLREEDKVKRMQLEEEFYDKVKEKAEHVLG